MLELGFQYNNDVLSIHDIAQKQNIPKRYLEQLLLMLRKAGLTMSIRGKKGGYRLAKTPAIISVADIFKAVEGSNNIVPTTKISKKNDPMLFVWSSLQKSFESTLNSITLECLIKKRKEIDKVLTYSI